MNKHDRLVLHSSKDLAKVTPQDLFDDLNHEFGFDIDVAADASNTKCSKFYDEAADGLAQPWAPYRCWCNPPYGREVPKWVAKAAEEANKGALVCMLLASRTDTNWFFTALESADEIRFIKGRLKFEGEASVAPFPSILIIWKGFHRPLKPAKQDRYTWKSWRL